MDFIESAEEILHEFNSVSVIVRIVLSVLIGGFIGFERGRHGRAAGLRTHILVCVGSAIASMTGIYMVTQFNLGDPSRIASGVVSGIGFLGAGIILVKGNKRVTGLTTAAAMWATSAIGLAVGAGFYIGALIGGAVVFFTIVLLTVFESKYKKDSHFYVEVEQISHVNSVVNYIKSNFATVHDIEIEPAKSGISGHVGIEMNMNTSQESGVSVTEKIMKLDGVVIAVEE